MQGLKLIPHSTIENTKILDIVKSLHNVVPYSELYNFKCLDHLKKEGEPLPINKLFKKDIFKKLAAKKEDTDLLILQNNIVYEIEITKEDVSFNIFYRDLDFIKETYSKYIPKIKFDDVILNNNLSIKDVSVIEMINKENIMFSLKTKNNSIEPLKYILDLKRILKAGEKFIFNVIAIPLSYEWWNIYNKSYKKFKSGKMPSKFSLGPTDLFKGVGNIALDVSLELLYCVEEILFGPKGVEKIDTTDDSLNIMLTETGLRPATKNKGKEKGFDVTLRGIAYSMNESRREFLLKQFSSCFSCLDLDNSLIPKNIKLNKSNLLSIEHRETIPTLDQDSMILSASELENFFKLPQITLQKEVGMKNLDYEEVKLSNELLDGYIPLGSLYGNLKITAYYSKIKDLLCYSKAIVSVKGAGKSKYFENYVYNAYKGGDCIIYFDYIENNQNAWEVAKHVPKKDLVILDLSKGFTFDYPELDINNIPKDDEYIRNIKGIASDYAMLIEKFINTINLGDAQELTSNMSNILAAASSISFLAGYKDLYSIYSILVNYKFREEAINRVKELNILKNYDFRFNELNGLNEYKEVKGKDGKIKRKVIGTNNKADRVLDRFNALLRSSKTEEMLTGIDRNNINFVDIFEENKVVLVLMPEDYFNDYGLKDIVMTYFLSRMKLAGQKRAALIKNREARKVVHIMLDEIHQLDNSTSLMIKNIAEDRKFRTTYVFACQFLKQFKSLLEPLLGTGCNFMLLAGCQKDNYKLLKEEIGDKFNIDELIKMPVFHSLNIIRGREKTTSTFITKLPEEL